MFSGVTLKGIIRLTLVHPSTNVRCDMMKIIVQEKKDGYNEQ